MTMKKTTIVLAAMAMVLICSQAGFAAGQQTVVEKTFFRAEPWTSTLEGGIHARAYGFVTVSSVKGGGAQVTVQLQKVAPRYTYVVKSLGEVLGKFTTDVKGTGGLQLFVADPSNRLGRYINIWQTLGEPEHSYWGEYTDWNSRVAAGTTADFEGLGLLWGPRW
jgi:hypothetical protein